MEEEILSLFNDLDEKTCNYLIRAYRYFSNTDKKCANEIFNLLCNVKKKFPKFKIYFKSKVGNYSDLDNMELFIDGENYLIFLHECGHIFHFISNKEEVPNKFSEAKKEIPKNSDVLTNIKKSLANAEKIRTEARNKIFSDEEISEEDFRELQVKYKAFSDVQDILCAFSGDSSYGHDRRYYTNDKVVFSEIIADYIAIYNCNYKDRCLQLIKEAVGNEFVDILETTRQEITENILHKEKSTITPKEIFINALKEGITEKNINHVKRIGHENEENGEITHDR